ncbi:VanZ family protein [Promicromonospora sp. NPDC057138]|uniref:VanZ family protein n=1 Tax=Promicromonospora sp. NPDC057138 TaxID=3346031 RepID=UPI0036446D6C
MIYDFLMFNRPFAYTALSLIGLLCIGLGFVLVRSSRYGRPALRTLAVLAVLPVLGLTLVPDFKFTPSDSDGIRCAVQFGVPSLNILELANMALFLVPVFFAALATRRPLVLFVAGAGLSALVEALQGLIPALGRACDTDDWVINTLGAAAGALLALGVLALAKRIGTRTAAEDRDAAAPAGR